MQPLHNHPHLYQGTPYLLTMYVCTTPWDFAVPTIEHGIFPRIVGDSAIPHAGLPRIQRYHR